MMMDDGDGDDNGDGADDGDDGNEAVWAPL